MSDWIRKIAKQEAAHFVYAPIPATPARQSPVIQETAIRAETHYLRVWLSEMFLQDDSYLYRTFVPVVHSVVSLQFGGNPVLELPCVAGPLNLGLGSTLGKGVQLNHPLTNLLPFRGGAVAISSALLAYKQKDFFQKFVDVPHDVSGLLNAGQLSATLNVVKSAADGIQNLLGAGDKKVHLVYFQGFGGDTAGGGVSLKSGYTAVINANAAQFKKDMLFVRNSQPCYGRDIQSAQPLGGYDYMLLRVEAAETRDDFLSFQEFAKLLNDAIREGFKDRAAGDAIIQAAQIAVWASPDLTRADRVRVAKGIRTAYEQALPGGTSELLRSVEDRVSILNDHAVAFESRKAIAAADALLDQGEVPLARFLEAVN